MPALLRTRCPHCQGVVKVNDSLVAKRVRCPGCQQVFEVSSVEVPLSPSLATAPQASETMASAAADTSAEVDDAARGLPGLPSRTALGGPGEPAQTPLGRLGRFELRATLGQGAFGRVYRAFDPQLEREVALKVPTFAADEKHKIQRFVAEAKAAARLRHANICPVFEVGDAEGKQYIAMAYISGRPLAQVIRSGKAVPLKAAVQIVRKLALALDHAHASGVVHRDLKPANVMLDDAGEPVVMDFGLARRDTSEDESRMTKMGVILGTPGYMSPEQVEGDLEKIGPATDVYGLGVILYELLTGRAPFSGSVTAVLGKVLTQEPEQASVLRPEVDASLDAICRKMMAKRLGDRFGSMKDVAAALAQWLKTTSQQSASLPIAPVSVRPIPLTRPPPMPAAALPIVRPSPASRRKVPPHLWIAAATGGILVTMLGAVFLLTMPGREPAAKKPPDEDSPRSPTRVAPGDSPQATPTSSIPSDAVIFQAHEYKYFAERLSWSEAQRRCEQMGGHLPIVETAAENTFLARMADGGFARGGRTGQEAIWLGASDDDVENEWRWTDDKRLLYANWDNGQPNNKGGDEHYAALWLASDPGRFGRWSDQPNVSTQHITHFICEWDGQPPPSPTAGVWINLFNGRDLSGWRRYADDSPITSGWVAADGAIQRTTGGGDIMTAGAYRDFELEFEWKISSGGNSGVIYRARTGGANPWQSGPEYQVLDDGGHVNGRNTLTSAGSVYGLAAPANKTLRPLGEWNTARIVARGTHLEHWLNGTKVLEIDTDSQAWLSAAAKIPFARNPGFSQNEGPICLQDHGSEVWFRNLRIREL